jgi:hypothetical protein
MQPVTIASVRAHGVRQLLDYCNGKREGDWLVIITASCRLSSSAQEKHCQRYSADAAARSAAGRRADLRPDYSRQQAALYGGGWMMPP